MTPAASELADVNEPVDETFDLRRGGVFALGTDHVFVVRGDDTVRVELGDILEIQHNSFDWFLGVISLVLVAFGLYSTTEHVLGGLAFAAAGAVSFYVTYRKRGRLTFKVVGRAKPLDLYPKYPEAVYEALRPLMAEE